MTPKKQTEIRVSDEWVDVTEHVVEPVHVSAGVAEEPESMSLDGLSPSAAMLSLRALKTVKGPVVITATLGRPLDQVVVDDHALSGQWVDGVWRFDAKSLDMACRVAGWSKVERDGEKWHLS